MTLLNDYARVFSQRFLTNRASAIAIYLTIRDAPRAVSSSEIVKLFPDVQQDDIYSIISVLLRYPEKNPLLRQSAFSQISTEYSASRFQDAKKYKLPYFIPELVRNEMVIGHRNRKYKYAKDAQRMETALYIIFTNHHALSSMVERESRNFPPAAKFFEPLVRDLDFVKMNPPKPIERKSSNI